MMSDAENNNNDDGTSPSIIIPRLQSGPPQTSTSELADALTRWLSASSTFLYVELSSLILLFACIADWYSTPWYKYALSVSSVSLIVCLTLQTAEFLIPDFLNWHLIGEREDGTGGHSVSKICSVFLLVWWIFGTGIITLHAPFVETSNGWFGAWGGLLATTKWCLGLKSTTYDSLPPSLKQLYHLTFLSILLLLSSIPPLMYKWEHYGGAGFSIAGAALTLVACVYLIAMYSDVPKMVMKVTSLLLFVLWACVAGVCTFHGPFLETTNGFFACWLGCLCSLNLMVLQMSDASPENYV
mmetsp:Transcript_31985/g.67692  ORF Transcript_31985/g.67692 Transcript_31985/m.67692 type:complete len:298 (+) Transcript_31985:326-1219(+)